MPDTQRTVSDLLTNLFQDGQADSAITPQEMRDLIVSVGKIPFGSIHTLAAAETIIATAGTYVKVAGTTQINVVSQMNMPADNRLRYTGVVPIHFQVVCSVQISFPGFETNQKVGLKLFKFDDSASSGALIDASEIIEHIEDGTKEETMVLRWDLQLDNQDYLELHITNTVSTGNPQVENLYFLAKGILL